MLDKGQELKQPQTVRKNIRANEKHLYPKLFDSLDANSSGYIHNPHLLETLEAKCGELFIVETARCQSCRSLR